MPGRCLEPRVNIGPGLGLMLGPVSQADLKGRVEAAAAAVLARQKFVTPVDVCVGIGWLHESNVEDWRRGRVDDLGYFMPVHDDRLIDLILYVHQWAEARGLTRTETVLLVEEPALEQAERQCLADEDARMRRRERDAERRAGEDLESQALFVKEIARLFPGCPPSAPRRSPGTPASGAAAGWAAQRRDGRSTRGP